MFYYIPSCSNTNDPNQFQKSAFDSNWHFGRQQIHSFNPTLRFHLEDSMSENQTIENQIEYMTPVYNLSTFIQWYHEYIDVDVSIIIYQYHQKTLDLKKKYPLHILRWETSPTPKKTWNRTRFFPTQKIWTSLASKAPELSVSKMRKSAWRSLRRASSCGSKIESDDRWDSRGEVVTVTLPMEVLSFSFFL